MPGTPTNLTCPICHKPVDPAAPDFPFCGPRCREIDLGNWASEKYVISTPAQPVNLDPESDEE